MKAGRIFLVIIILIFLIFSVIFYLKIQKPVPTAVSKFQKGVTYVTWSKEAYGRPFSKRSLKKLASTNTEWVAIITTWYQEKYDSTIIQSTLKTPSDESLVCAIKDAHALGMKVMLKPHLDLSKDIGSAWRGEIDHRTTQDWIKWFNSYCDFICHYAKMAQEHDVEMFCIGTELTNPALLKPELWKEIIIKNVRRVYKGPITYAANWHDEYVDIKFWEELDYAGLDPYFPLSDKEQPTLEDLKEGWHKFLEDIEDWQASIDKPVIFTEIGYKSSTGAAKSPWEHSPGRELDLELQANCYRALLETFWEKEWFYGVYWWYWGTNERMGAGNNRGFIIQNKPVEEVLSKWYKKPK